MEPHPTKVRTLLTGCLALALSACGGDDAPMGASVSFLQPQDGATLMGPDVAVALEVSGIEIVPVSDTRPGTGHHHIFIDDDVTPAGQPIPMDVPNARHFGTGVEEFTLEGLEPGTHRLIAVVADWQHVPLDPLVVDTIRITVAAPPSE